MDRYQILHRLTVSILLAPILVSSAAAEKPTVGQLKALGELLQWCHKNGELIGVTHKSGQIGFGAITSLNTSGRAAEWELEFDCVEGNNADRGPRFRIRDLLRVGVRDTCFHVKGDQVVATQATRMGQKWVHTKPENQRPTLRAAMRVPEISIVRQAGHIFYGPGNIGEVNGRKLRVKEFIVKHDEITKASADRKNLALGQMLFPRMPSIADLNGPNRKPMTYFRQHRIFSYHKTTATAVGTLHGNGKSISLTLNWRNVTKDGKKGKSIIYPTKEHLLPNLIVATAKESGKLYLKAIVDAGRSSSRKDKDDFANFLRDIADSTSERYKKGKANKQVIIRPMIES